MTIHRFRPVRLLALACLVAVSLHAGPTGDKEEEAGDVGRVRDLLRTIIIPYVKANDVPVSELAETLTKLSGEHDPDKRGILVTYVPIVVDGKPAPAPTIIMQFSQIPLGELIRYTCTGASAPLSWEITPTGVRIGHDIPTDPAPTQSDDDVIRTVQITPNVWIAVPTDMSDDEVQRLVNEHRAKLEEADGDVEAAFEGVTPIKPPGPEDFNGGLITEQPDEDAED